MDTGIQNLKDLIEVTAWIVGATSLAFAAYTYRLNRNQFNFSVITDCTKRYQAIMPALRSSDKEQRLSAIRQYIDLCNEELFYFKNRYIPEEVIDEWLDGMILSIPYFCNGKNTNNSDTYFFEIVQLDMLRAYPRITHAFNMDREYDISCRKERSELIRAIKKNLKNHPADPY